MADALIGVTETSAVGQATIANIVQSYLQQSSILLPTVTNYSFLVTPGSKSISIPRSGGFTVGDKSENTAADATIATFAADAITLNKHKYIQFLIEKIAAVEAVPAILADLVKKASMDMAYQLDKDIVVALKAASSSAPDHVHVFADTTNDVIAASDILKARKLLQEQNIDASQCFIGIGPEKESEILAISGFIGNAYVYGSADPIQNGVIGKLYGMPVLVSNAFADFMCAWHPSAVGYAFAQNMVLDSDKDLANLGTRYSLDMIYGTATLDSGKRQVFIDSTN